MFFGPTLTQVPECFICDVEVCESIAIVHIAIVARDLAAAARKLHVLFWLLVCIV